MFLLHGVQLLAENKLQLFSHKENQYSVCGMAVSISESLSPLAQSDCEICTPSGRFCTGEELADEYLPSVSLALRLVRGNQFQVQVQSE
jgi:hypothetical protein